MSSVDRPETMQEMADYYGVDVDRWTEVWDKVAVEENGLTWNEAATLSHLKEEDFHYNRSNSAEVPEG